MSPKWGFRVAMLPVGALCFYQAHFRRMGFQNGHFGRISFTLYFTVFRNLGRHASARRMSHKPCFRQAHRFMQGPLRFLPVPSNPTCARSHIWGFPRDMVVGFVGERYRRALTTSKTRGLSGAPEIDRFLQRFSRKS